MSLTIVNPTKRKPAKRRRAKRTTTTTTASPARKKGVTMAKRRRRSPAQRAAFKRMISGLHRTKNPVRRAARRRRYANPVHVYQHRRRHRNPGLVSRGGVLGELMSKEGLMGMGTVVVLPTITTLALGYLMPSATGYTKVVLKGAIGIGIGVALAKWLNRKAGMVACAVAGGTMIAEAIQQYQAGAAVAAPASAATLSAMVSPRGQLAMSGYASAMSGYGMQHDPGYVRL